MTIFPQSKNEYALAAAPYASRSYAMRCPLTHPTAKIRMVLTTLELLPPAMDKLIVMLLQLIPYCIMLLVFIAVAWYALRLLRANLVKTEHHAIDYLKSFQKLHEQGKITDEEFRIVRRLVSLHIIQNSKEPK